MNDEHINRDDLEIFAASADTALSVARNQRDKYKAERDELQRLLNVWKQELGDAMDQANMKGIESLNNYLAAQERAKHTGLPFSLIMVEAAYKRVESVAVNNHTLHTVPATTRGWLFPSEVLPYIVRLAELTGIRRAAIEGFDVLEMAARNPLKVCWDIKEELYWRSGNLRIEIVENLDLEWARQHISNHCTTHATLHRAITHAYRCRNTATTQAAYARAESIELSTMKKYSVCLNKIDEHAKKWGADTTPDP